MSEANVPLVGTNRESRLLRLARYESPESRYQRLAKSKTAAVSRRRATDLPLFTSWVHRVSRPRDRSPREDAWTGEAAALLSLLCVCGKGVIEAAELRLMS